MVISLHDVAPPFEEEVRAQLDALSRLGVDRCVLKVVPRWHGAYPLTTAPTLVEMLRERQVEGNELALHGLEHRRHGPLRGTRQQRVRADLFAGDAAEFLTVDPVTAGPMVREGIEVFAAAGLAPPAGFCAPGWLLAPDLKVTLRDAGIAYLIGALSVIDLRRSYTLLTPAQGYMGASPGQELGIHLGNRLADLTMGKAGVIKLYLHPAGGTSSPFARWVLSQIARLLEEGWRPVTFSEVIGAAG